MSKRLLISIVPLLATAGLAVMTSAAQGFGNTAPWPAYYSNGLKVPVGTQVPTLSWGTLTLAVPGHPAVTCQNAAIGYAENTEPETGKTRGIDETDSFATSNCRLSTNECKTSEGVEAVVTPEYLPWASKLEFVAGTPQYVRDRTYAAPPSTPGFSSGLFFLSTEGAQVVTHCEFRGEQPEVKQLAEALCKREFPGTSTATVYNPATRESVPVEADGFMLYDIEAQTACSGAGQAAEEAEVARRPSTVGDPASYNVPGAPVVQCEGENAPRLANGNSLLKPSTVTFDQNGKNGGEAENTTTGTLECGEFGAGTTTGKLQTIGYTEGELIATK
jgi:hypothetical protein